MEKIDYNKKYRFISKKDEWFKEGCECVVEDGHCLCDYRNGKRESEITYEEMVNNPEEFHGLFQGIRICNTPEAEANHKLGEEYFDGEWCTLDEFEVVKK